MLSSPSASLRADILRPETDVLFTDEEVAGDRDELGGGCRTGSFLEDDPLFDPAAADRRGL